ncbi:hypothetical protein HET69_05125 [Streptomyces sp. CJ_13]|uniref:hypothetical protein n=1 Tax=Streptomyces sp. CJ_13 TaxID=2724943 RepID=UPI001BDBFC7B|nr:hypothetical protein [Streptomyces sp. CJ_13]MBT1183407.1 hypothetical protein [Streptomyces sp. CJ_13]
MRGGVVHQCASDVPVAHGPSGLGDSVEGCVDHVRDATERTATLSAPCALPRSSRRNPDAGPARGRPELIVLPVTAPPGRIDDEPCADASSQEALGHATPS